MRTSVLAFVLGASFPASGARAPLPSRGSSAGVDTIRPGSAVLDPHRVPTYQLDRGLTITRGDTTRPFGRQMERLSDGTLDGRAVLLHVIRFDTPNALTIDSSWVDRATLAPIRMLSTNRNRTLTLDFDPGVVHKTTVPAGGSPVREEIPVDASSFEWNMLPVALAGLPLEKGYRASLPVFSDRAGRVIWYAIEVVDEVFLTRSTGFRAPMWRVVGTPDSDAPHAEWWVSRRHGFVDQAVVSEPGVAIRYVRGT